MELFDCGHCTFHVSKILQQPEIDERSLSSESIVIPFALIVCPLCETRTEHGVTMNLWERLNELAQEMERPLDELLRHHIQEGVLRRLAISPAKRDFVLRGGMLTRHLVAPIPRLSQDLDFVGTFPFDVEDAIERFRMVVCEELNDGVELTNFKGKGIWERTEFPGVRMRVNVATEGIEVVLQIDVGFNDPLVPEPELVVYPSLVGPDSEVWCCRAETMIGWKLHGLAEMGRTGWRPKDLHDLYLLVTSVSIQLDDLAPAIEAAFVSRGYALADAWGVFTTPNWWEPKSAFVKWAEFRQSQPDMPVPEDLGMVARTVYEKLATTFRQLQQEEETT